MRQPEEDDASLNIREYLAQFRERIWIFLLIFITVFGASIIYTFNARPMYSAMATVVVLRDDPNFIAGGPEVDSVKIINQEDFRTQVNKLSSATIVRKVAKRLKDDELEAFMEPYQNAFRFEGPYSPEEVLSWNRIIEPIRQSLTINVGYRHPDRDMAAKIANLFVDEFRQMTHDELVGVTLQAVELLKTRCAKQREEVERLEASLAEYRKKYGIVSLEDRTDIDRQELAQLRQILTEKESVLDEARAAWELVQRYQQEGRDLWDLPFIGENPQVQQLLTNLSTSKVEIAALKERYRHKHPQMIQATESLDQTIDELRRVLHSAAEKIRATYERAKTVYETAQQNLKRKEQEILDMGNVQVEYKTIESDIEVAKVIYQGMLQNLELQMAQSVMKQPNINIQDEAVAPPFPSSPNHKINLALGFCGGIGLGLMVVFALAFIDDRVKSSMAVENALQMNLVAIIPSIKRMDSFRKARIAENNADPRAAEAFRSLYSTIRISDIGRHSQVIITTSTLPSEGKSFVATNLALSFAAHGERTLLIDGDFRMPAIAQSLRSEKQVKEHGDGLVGYFEGKTDWENMVVSEIVPMLDLLASTRGANTPSEIANSSHFIDIINVMRERYDRIIIDTPPMGIVSDTLALVPAVDACLYVIRHKVVKMRNVRSAITRLREVHMPILGAVMNQVDRLGTSYYHHYHDSGKSRYYGGYVRKAKAEKLKSK